MVATMGVSLKTINGAQSHMDYVKDWAADRHEGLQRISASRGLMADMSASLKNNAPEI